MGFFKNRGRKIVFRKEKKTFLDFVPRRFPFPKVMNLNKKKNAYVDLKFVDLEF
jgi:hypothetical protein